MADQRDKNELMQQASALHLNKLVNQYPDDLERALANSKALIERLPGDLHWSEEPAHTYSLAPKVPEPSA